MALKCTAIRLLLTSLIARGLTFGLRSATTQHCVKPWHQGRHLRLSCLGAANGSACVLHQLEAQIYKAAWPSWQRGNDMAQLGNSPSFANLRMTIGWALCSDINANCKLRQEGEGGKEGAGSKRASGMPSVVIEGALKTLRKRQVTLCPGPEIGACVWQPVLPISKPDETAKWLSQRGGVWWARCTEQSQRGQRGALSRDNSFVTAKMLYHLDCNQQGMPRFAVASVHVTCNLIS
jgi:hypothetical protein